MQHHTACHKFFKIRIYTGGPAFDLFPKRDPAAPGRQFGVKGLSVLMGGWTLGRGCVATRRPPVDLRPATDSSRRELSETEAFHVGRIT